MKKLFEVPTLDKKNTYGKDKILHYIESEGVR